MFGFNLKDVITDLKSWSICKGSGFSYNTYVAYSCGIVCYAGHYKCCAVKAIKKVGQSGWIKTWSGGKIVEEEYVGR